MKFYLLTKTLVIMLAALIFMWLGVWPFQLSSVYADEPDASNVELLNQIGGRATTAFIRGSYAYVGLGPRLIVLDISTPTAPVLVGRSTPLPGFVFDVHVAGTYALTVTNSGTATNLVITDAISAGATYITGGTKVDDVVSWTIASLAANGGVIYTTFVVTATETITNTVLTQLAETRP